MSFRNFVHQTDSAPVSEPKDSLYDGSLKEI